LSVEELQELKRILKAKPYWSVKEVMRLVKELFGVNYSDEQIRRILVEKLGMNYAKPFVRDYRRPKDAEDIFAARIEGATKNLRDKGYKDEEVVIGFLDKASPQNQTNTVRVLSFGKPRVFKKYGQDESQRHEVLQSEWDEYDILPRKFKVGKHRKFHKEGEEEQP